MQISKAKPYKSVALIYNGLMAKVDYNHWSNYLISLVEPYLNSEAKVLDLGAGNCNMVNHIRLHFPNIMAADISFDMLRSDQNETNKVCCDMTSLPFNTKFDFIYSTFDCVNYLLKKHLLKNLLIETARILSAGGIFTFDICLEKNSRGNGKKQVTEGSYSSIKFKQVSSYNRLSKIHKNDFTVYYPEGNVVHEIHKQKIYSFNTYIRLISDSNFELLNCFETFTRKKANEESNRAQFILQKRG